MPVSSFYINIYHSVSNETCIKVFDFTSMKVTELLTFSVKLKFVINKVCVVHGIAGWFDTLFYGSNSEHVLSTSPKSPTTHWYQVRFLLDEPLAINQGQLLKGSITFQANKFQSYNITLKLKIDGLNFKRECHYDLKNPDFRNSYISTSTWNQEIK
jgi:type I protein arginine methyltransferase